MTTSDVLPAEVASSVGDDEILFEVVNDQRVELPPMGMYAVRVAFKLASRIEQFAEASDLGLAFKEGLFRLKSRPLIQRRPDAAFVSFDRWPKGKPIPPGDAMEIVPDLAVEVVSPTNLAEEIPTKIREYFEAGVRRVWIFYLNENLVYEYDSPDQIRILKSADFLEGGDIIPGFRLALAELLFALGPEPA